MKKVYNYEINYNSTIYADDTETICVVDDNGNATFYYAVFNPQFRNNDEVPYYYAYVFEELTDLIGYIGSNASSEVYQEEHYVHTKFKTKEEYIKWFNNLAW